MSGSGLQGRSGPFDGVKLSHALAAALLLVALAIAVNTPMAFGYDRYGVYEQYNILFDADPNETLPCFAQERGGRCQSFTHPNITNIIYPPVWLTARIGERTGIVDDADLARRPIAFMVTPIVSGGTAVVLLATGLVLGLGLLRSFLLGLLLLASFSQLVFGSIPEHFALGGLAVALTMLLVALEARGRAPPVFAWLAVAWFGASMTISNIVLVAGAYGICLLRRDTLPRAAGKTTAFGVAALALVFAFMALMGQLRGREGAPVSVDHVQETVEIAGFFFEPQPVRKLLAYPAAIGETILPGRIVKRELDIRPTWPEEVKERTRQARYQFILVIPDHGMGISLASVAIGLGGLALLIYLVAGTVRYWRDRDDARGLVAACAFAILAFNGLFHAFWGNEYFLYSQHWLAASLVPIALLCSAGRLRRSHSVAVLGALLLVVAVVNAYWVHYLFDTLATA